MHRLPFSWLLVRAKNYVSEFLFFFLRVLSCLALSSSSLLLSLSPPLSFLLLLSFSVLLSPFSWSQFSCLSLYANGILGVFHHHQLLLYFCPFLWTVFQALKEESNLPSLLSSDITLTSMTRLMVLGAASS